MLLPSETMDTKGARFSSLRGAKFRCMFFPWGVPKCWALVWRRSSGDDIELLCSSGDSLWLPADTEPGYLMPKGCNDGKAAMMATMGISSKISRERVCQNASLGEKVLGIP
eukprot:TRINITY_DN54611_c0_g1_i1.p1 TRINITY_DN54611_c0_g1~~TRINITY_DN54611_c0_g1_i1.p1  ORF type:complete len:119 (+),score=22.11 TRINITY_DN54611_c0_g1_i1:25-357(+)